MNNQRHHIMKVTKRILMILLTLVGISTGAWADGNPDGVFTINSDGDQVIFSKGNLQYQASTNTWRFAENQYDYIGNAVGNTSPSASQTAWIDYFNWGTSGYNHGATCYQPWSTSTSRGNYYAYGSSSKNLYDAKDDGSMRGQADWGYNAISNGGNTENSGWRTLTKEEWAYIITSRTDSYKYAKGTIHSTNGMILFPDGFTPPSGISISNANTAGAGYSSYSDTDWSALEAVGCVFLPATGLRNGTTVMESGTVGNYWSSTYMNGDRVYNIRFDGSSLKLENDGDRQNGFPVRLVKNYSSLEQDADGYYLLGSVQNWKDFAKLVKKTPNVNAKMTADINLGDDQTMIGSGTTWSDAGEYNHHYKGIFDGQGHTLTINYNSSEVFTAPFRHINSATIKNLRVTGTITTNKTIAASIAASCSGISMDSYITNCVSSVDIISNYVNTGSPLYDGARHGGFVGQLFNQARINFNDCVFNGSISGENQNVLWGGFVGLCDGTVKVTNCLQSATFDCTNVVSESAGTFSTIFQNDITITNGYYLNQIGVSQGTQVTTDDLSNGTTTAALNNNRTGDEAPWVQQGNQPMLKIFVPDNGISTGIDNGQRSKGLGQRDDWYTIDGRKLNGKPAKKGIYINDGNKVVIK